MKLKKILAAALAGTMVLGATVAVSAETLAGVDWWSQDNPVSSSYALADGESVEFTIVYEAAVEDPNATIEVTDGTVFIDCNFGVQGNAWTFADTGDAVIESNFEDGFDLVEGNTYTATVSRDGNVYTFAYYDVTADEACYTVSVTTDATLGDTNVYVIAQRGTYEVTVTEVVEEEITNTDVIVGVDWWNSENQTSSKYALADGESVEFTVVYDEAVEDPNATIEVTDGTIFIDCNFGVQGNAWTFADTGDAVIESNFEDGFDLVEGHTYTATVSRDGNVYTFAYYDVTADEACYTVSVTTDSALGDANVYVVAQRGTYTVSVTTTEESVVPAEPTTPSDPTTPGEEETEEPQEPEVPEGSETMEFGSDWWVKFSQAFEITADEPLVITVKTTSLEGADGFMNWYNIVYAIYTSEDSKVYAGDSEQATSGFYKEYWVGRADNFGWGAGAITETNVGDDFDWAAWLEATKAGAEVTITAQIVDGAVVLTLSCAGVEYTVTTDPVDTDKPVYLALTGQNCILSDLTVNGEPTLFGNVASEEEPADETPADETPADGTTTAPKTADTMPIIPVAAALVGCAVIAVAAKKKVVK